MGGSPTSRASSSAPTATDRLSPGLPDYRWARGLLPSADSASSSRSGFRLVLIARGLGRRSLWTFRSQSPADDELGLSGTSRVRAFQANGSSPGKFDLVVVVDQVSETEHERASAYDRRCDLVARIPAFEEEPGDGCSPVDCLVVVILNTPTSDVEAVA